MHALSGRFPSYGKHLDFWQFWCVGQLCDHHCISEEASEKEKPRTQAWPDLLYIEEVCIYVRDAVVVQLVFAQVQ